MNSLDRILKVFENIPVNQLLETAYALRSNSDFSSSMVNFKIDKSVVTKADLELQKQIINYFLDSEIGKQCFVKAEEDLGSLKNASSDHDWQLIIDPLDGTSAYSTFQDQWGIMIGICNRAGELLHSLNVLSYGQVFPTLVPLPENITKIARKKDNILLIDFYSYDEIPHDKFFESVKAAKAEGLTGYNIRLTSHPAAVYVGWNLYAGNIDALVWVSSSQQKQTYPDYDLLFLSAVKQQGYEVQIGIINQLVEILIVAENKKLADDLWNTAVLMLPEVKKTQVKKETSLLITGAI